MLHVNLTSVKNAIHKNICVSLIFQAKAWFFITQVVEQEQTENYCFLAFYFFSCLFFVFIQLIFNKILYQICFLSILMSQHFEQNSRASNAKLIKHFFLHIKEYRAPDKVKFFFFFLITMWTTLWTLLRIASTRLF